MSSATPPKEQARRVMVTGAGGFVGKHVLSALRAAGWRADEVVATRRPNEKMAPMSIKSVEIELESSESIAAAIDLVKPTAVIHLAAIAEPAKAREDVLTAWRINLLSTVEIAEALRRRTPGAIFVFAGSSEAYGESFRVIDGPLTEDAPLRPNTVYAATKAAADIALAQMAREGLRTIRFRAFNHTGPGQAEGFVVPAFARQIALIESGARAPVLLAGNLDAERDFLDVRDVARAYVLALENPPVAGAVYNVCSGRTRRIGDILTTLMSYSSVDIEVQVDPARMRASEVPTVVGCNRNIRMDLGWAPETSLEDTLRDVLDDWRARVME